MRRSSSFSCALLFAFSLVGCPKPEPKKEATPAAKPPAEIPSDFVLNDFFGDAAAAPGAASHGPTGDAPPAPPAADNKGSVKVIEPGAEPRVARTYAFAVGKTQTVNVTLRSSMTQDAAGQPASREEQPPMLFGIALTPKAKLPPQNGEVDYAIEMKLVKAEVSLPPAMAKDPQAAELVSSLKSVEGLGGVLRIDEHGVVRDVSIAPPDPKANPSMTMAAAQVLPLLEQALESIFVVLPPDAIGKGAKWEVDTTNHENGINETSKAIYTLTDIVNDALQLSVATTRSAPKQTVKDPRQSASIQIDGTEKATLTLRLDRMVIKGESDTSLTLTIEQGAPPGPNGQPSGKPKSMTQKAMLHQVIENVTK